MVHRKVYRERHRAITKVLIEQYGRYEAYDMYNMWFLREPIRCSICQSQRKSLGNFERVNNMDLIWEFQQENARLRKEIETLKELIRINGILKETPLSKRVFTDNQIEFIRSVGVSYQVVYGLARKYESANDALVGVLEDSV